jgi:simple sugar transport system permease protein
VVLAVIGIGMLLAVRARKASAATSAYAIPLAVAIVGVALTVIVPHISLPTQFWLSMEYVLPLLALAGFVRRAKAPSALAAVYRTGARL